MHALTSILVIASLLILPTASQAGEIVVRSGQSGAKNTMLKIVSSELTITTGFKAGYFSYQIGGIYSDGQNTGLIHFPLSELKFPLNVGTVQFDYLMKLNNHWQAAFIYETNYSTNSGKMEDSDWGVVSTLITGAIDDPKSLDVFSRSKSELKYKEYSLNISKDRGKSTDVFNFETWETYLGFGITVQDYNFEISDGVQIYPSINRTPTNLNGKVLLYDFLQITPYLSAQFQTPKKKKFGFSVNLSVSPLVRIGDFDNHLLRNKSSDGNTSGWSLKGDVGGRWRLLRRFDLFLMIKSQYTKASGWQKQYDTKTKITSAKVKLKHFSLQNNIYIGGKFWL